MKLFIKLGLFFLVIILTTGCHTMIFVNENEEEEAAVEEYAGPSPAMQIILDITPFLFRELIFNPEPHPHHLPPPVVHDQKSQGGSASHTDGQRTTQTGRNSGNTGAQSTTRNDSGQNTRDSGARRSGR